MTSVVTRFAPSPTGFLHIGSVRTALFNWLYARHRGGKFLLRIEDTDRERSTEEAIQAIIEGLKWLDLSWDDDIVFQFKRAARHQEVAHQLVASGKAYYCFCTPEELEAMRTQARAEGRQPRYDGRWRDRDPREGPAGVRPVVRLKVPLEGATVVQDSVQGEVEVHHTQLDDMVLLRADGTPTYMLAVVVDDHDMGITHVIRGDDHLTNTFRQIQIYNAMEWSLPVFSHIPLIHGQDGAKLSKRHGALGIEAYAQMGFLPETLCNYLLKLGWGHGDDEIISRDQAVQWFDIRDVGRAAARFDLTKLSSLNGHYLRESDNERLFSLLAPFLHQRSPLSWPKDTDNVDPVLKERVLAALSGLKQRARTLEELADQALFLIHSRPLTFDEKARALLNTEAQQVLTAFLEALRTPEMKELWQEKPLEDLVRTFAEQKGLKVGAVAQPLRAALTGRVVSPGIFEIMVALGRAESLNRIQDALSLEEA